MGNDYYDTNEHWVAHGRLTAIRGEIFGYNEITRQYYDRYRLPVMHTETNTYEGPARTGCRALAPQGVGQRPAGAQQRHAIVGFTWYSLTDQVDWDTRLRARTMATCDALGLFDLDRTIRPVGSAYKQLIRDWREVLPAQSLCLTVPIAPLEPDGARDGGRTPPRADPSRTRMESSNQAGDHGQP